MNSYFWDGFNKCAEKSYSGSQGDSLTPAISQGKIDDPGDTMKDRTLRDMEQGPKNFQLGVQGQDIQDEVIPLVSK
jgi:hypothetical protein